MPSIATSKPTVAEVTWDPVSETTYIEISTQGVNETVVLEANVLVDIGYEGQVVGVEFLNTPHPPEFPHRKLT